MKQQRAPEITAAQILFVCIVAALFALWSSPASAQVAPGTFTTVKSTSSAATSMCVGCPTGSTSPAADSGITARTIVLPTSGAPSVTTNKIYQIGSALFFNGLALATGSSISGTTNQIPKFTAATTLADSTISDNGTTVTIAALTQSNGTVTSGTNGAAGSYIVNGPSATNRVLAFRTAGLARWFAYTTSVAESGGNAGSNFRLDAFDDAGTLIGTTLLATRSSLAVTLGGALTVTGASVLSGATTIATSLQLVGAAPVFLGNTNNGYLFRNSTNGATILSVTDAGVITLPGATTASTTFTVTGAATNSSTLAQVGVATFTAQPIFSSLTASQAVFTDGSKGLVSNAITGSGSVVMSAGPTLTGTVGLPAATMTGLLQSNFSSATFALSFTDAAGGGIAATNAAGVLRWYTGGTNLRWGINAAGDTIFGASSHVADSSGTPTIASGFGSSPTISGNDYAFIITMGSGAGNVGGVITFGHGTFTTLPVCVYMSDSAGLVMSTGVISTTQLPIDLPSSTYTGKRIFVLCRGY